ncbi:hypothetical protein BJY04DRAFT_213156 [Aspergillus karnatakaensis]|uniref:uncharacterized protein n=1 Tax=Aspergillus karnatakaensis TaxID=1810916 RepID=UPI003CCD59BD
MTTTETVSRLAYQVSAATWPFTAVSTVLFGMRSYSRWRLQTDKLGLEDAIITISWMLNIVRAAVIQKGVYAVYDVDMAELPSTLPSALFWVTFCDAWAFFSIDIPKLGIAIMCNKLFRPRKAARVLVLAAAILLNVLAAIGFIITFVQCDPVPGQFDRWKYPNVQCWDVLIIYACSVSGFSAALNVGFSIWPGVVIWKLKLSTSRKLTAMALMSVGFASSAFAFVKVHANTELIGVSDSLLYLDKALRIALWNSIENDFVMIAACLPASSPVFRAAHRVWCTWTGSSSGGSSSSSYQYPGMHGYTRSSKRKPADPWTLELVSNVDAPGECNPASIQDLNGSGVLEQGGVRSKDNQAARVAEGS